MNTPRIDLAVAGGLHMRPLHGGDQQRYLTGLGFRHSPTGIFEKAINASRGRD